MIWNSLRLAWRSLRRNLLRSFLTLLGIVIGVAAVITMVSLGQGATLQVTQQVASLGSNLLVIRSGQRGGPGQTTAVAPLSLADAAAITKEIRSVAYTAASATAQVKVVNGNSNWSGSATGVDSDYFTVRNWQLSAGREFVESELRSGKAVCILGSTVHEQLFGRQDPLGSSIRVKDVACQVVGVMRAKGVSAFGNDQDDVLFMPLRALQRRIVGNQEIGAIHVAVREGIPTATAEAEITLLLRERRRIASDQEEDFRITDMREIASTLTATTEVLTNLLGAVAAVSLLVGGIGIMNIMLVSVTERTREIGIRLAIGALEHEVLLQFLVEAVALSSLGGLLGIVLALGAATLLAEVMQLPFVFDLTIVAIAFGFSAAIGILFGFFPARKAAKLNPIEALRHE